MNNIKIKFECEDKISPVLKKMKEKFKQVKQMNKECRGCGNPNPSNRCEYCGTDIYIGSFKDITHISGPVSPLEQFIKNWSKEVKLGRTATPEWEKNKRYKINEI